MGFVGPKLAWLLLSPGNLLTLLALAGLLLLATPWRRLGRALTVLTCLGVVAVGTLPLGGWLLWPLETRFPTVTALPPADQLGGIVVLGGAVRTAQTAAHGQPSLSEGAERMTEAAALARRYPSLPMVFTGGDATLFGGALTEAQVAAMVFAQLGLPADRVRYEGASRNTYENAVLTFDAMQPRGDKPWLLVTSAAHMPRSVGCFRKAGWHVLPYPVDYVTVQPGWTPGLFLADNLYLFSNAVREWLGLAFYHLAGRTDAFLPGPRDS